MIATETDIYSHERATLREQLDVLNGRTTWREPHSGHGGGFRADSTPHEHTLAAALAFARDRSGPGRDIGPDILESLVYRRVIREREIVYALVRAMADMSSVVALADRGHVRDAAVEVVRECVTGAQAERPGRVAPKVWLAVSTLGVRLLWASAGQTLRAAGEALR